MFQRDGAEFRNEQNVRMSILVNEAVDGITKMDVLPNTAQPLRGEVEAMYFVGIRTFMGNTVSRLVMTHGQDVYRGM